MSELNDAELKQLFSDFCKTIAQLRDPQHGCPWDLQQDHASLRQYMLEEAYEAASEMTKTPRYPALCEELGDVLLQVVLNAQVAADFDHFTIKDVIQSINEKMIRRHPHVFDRESRVEKSQEAIKRNWDRIKEEEKKKADKEFYFSEAAKITPSLSRAHKIGKMAKKIAFDWDNAGQVIQQLKSEIQELEEALALKEERRDHIEKEMADILFTAAQLTRHLGFEAESVAHLGNEKFIQRFKEVEKLAQKQGLNVRSASRDQLEALWQKAKGLETP